MIDDYLENLKMIFAYHGCILNLGVSQVHEDATEESYAMDIFTESVQDPETMDYAVRVDVKNYIPMEDVRSSILSLMETILSDTNAKVKVKK